MKKQLLFTSLFFSGLCVFSQNGNIKPQPSGKFNMAKKIALKFDVSPAPLANGIKQSASKVSSTINSDVPAQALVLNPPTSISWQLLCGSSNCYGQLESHARPLQYNPNVNAVSYIHRKSASYTATPSGYSNSGTILAEISSDWGVSWDSTCIWADPTNAGRYPQGAIYSAAGNTNIANAYVVASGPALSGNNFTGNFYASKKLAAPGSTLYNTTADATPMAQQFISNISPTYAVNQGPHGWSRYGFSSTDDGLVRSLALIEDNLNDLITMRGVSVVKGSFNAGVFNWTTDSITPSCIISGGAKVLSSEVQMAFNQAGNIGYVMMTGALTTATASNKGYQPIIYKTTNSGASWAQIPGINFNAPPMTAITKNLAAVATNGTLSIPYFNQYDIAVDANGKLHIGAIIASTASNHNDSLGYISQFTMSINPGDNYEWRHTPGFRPYLFDFIGDGTSGWIPKLIDSLSTEDPGADPATSGGNLNPWDIDAGFKINVDPRLQLSRTPDGQYITFSWEESDTNFVLNSKKWNVLPNIKARCMAVGTGTSAYLHSQTEINVSRPAIGTGTLHPKVADKAFLHFMSPITGAQTTFTGAGTSTVDINTPFTVTNSNPLGQIASNTTWYSSAKLSFKSFTINGAISIGVTVGLAEKELNSVTGSVLYPNPAKNSAALLIDMKDNTTVTINVYNVVGQLLKTTKAEAHIGENNININLDNLSSGIYMVNVKAGTETSIKKLIIE